MSNLNQLDVWTDIKEKNISINTLRNTILNDRNTLINKQIEIDNLLKMINDKRNEKLNNSQEFTTEELQIEEQQWVSVNLLQSEIDNLNNNIKQIRTSIIEKTNIVNQNINLLQENVVSNLPITSIKQATLKTENIDVNGDINIKGFIYKDTDVYLDPNKYKYIDKFDFYYSGIYNDFSFNMYLSDSQNNFTHYTVLKDTIIDNILIHQIGEPEAEYNVNILIEREISNNINNDVVLELESVFNGKQTGYYNTPPPVDNLALWVPFERDSTNIGSNKDYQILGASISKDIGKFGQNCATYGISSGIATTEIDPTPSNWTFCFWYKFMQTNSSLGSDNKYIAYMLNPAGTINGNFTISIDTPNILFRVVNGTTIDTFSYNVSSNESVLLNWVQEWHHYGITKDGNTVKYYIDGVLLGSRTLSNLTWYISPIQFGTIIHYYKAHDSSGKVDDVRWYTRTLSDSEISNFNTITVNNTESQKLVPINIPIYKNDKIRAVINRTNKYLDKGIENVKLLLYTSGEQQNIVSINKPYLFLFHRLALNNTPIVITAYSTYYSILSGFSIGNHYNIIPFNDGFVVNESGIYKIRVDYYEINGGNEGFFYTISDSSTNIINENVIMSKNSTGDGMQWVMNLEKEVKYSLYIRAGNTRTISFREISIYIEKIQDTTNYKEWNANETSIYNIDKNVSIGKYSGNYKLDVSGDINFSGNLLKNGIPLGNNFHKIFDTYFTWNGTNWVVMDTFTITITGTYMMYYNLPQIVKQDRIYCSFYDVSGNVDNVYLDYYDPKSGGGGGCQMIFMQGIVNIVNNTTFQFRFRSSSPTASGGLNFGPHIYYGFYKLN
jgi:hypothetical protein